MLTKKLKFNNQRKSQVRNARKRLISKVARQIADACHPEKILLFGSHAYGSPNHDSDVDFLVVLKSKQKPMDRSIQVYKSLNFYPFPMDIIVRAPQEIKRRIQMGDPFYQEILMRGKVLYER